MFTLSNDGVIREADGALIPNDVDNADWRDYLAWLAAGNTPNQQVVLDPTPDTPRVVSMMQARLALLKAGLLDAVTNSVATADKETQIAWEYATDIRRDSPTVQHLAMSLGLTTNQIDDLFITAAKLSA